MGDEIEGQHQLRAMREYEAAAAQETMLLNTSRSIPNIGLQAQFTSIMAPWVFFPQGQSGMFSGFIPTQANVSRDTTPSPSQNSGAKSYEGRKDSTAAPERVTRVAWPHVTDKRLNNQINIRMIELFLQYEMAEELHGRNAKKACNQLFTEFPCLLKAPGTEAFNTRLNGLLGDYMDAEGNMHKEKVTTGNFFPTGDMAEQVCFRTTKVFYKITCLVVVVDCNDGARS